MLLGFQIATRKPRRTVFHRVIESYVSRQLSCFARGTLARFAISRTSNRTSENTECREHQFLEGSYCRSIQLSTDRSDRSFFDFTRAVSSSAASSVNFHTVLLFEDEITDYFVLDVFFFDVVSFFLYYEARYTSDRSEKSDPLKMVRDALRKSVLVNFV